VKDELEMWKKVVVAWFDVLFWY